MTRTDFHFMFPFRVRYAETDAQGIVFNAHYLTYFDTAIYEYFRALSYDFLEHVEQTGTDVHTVRVVIDFHAPSRFDDELEVHVRTDRIGRSSMTFVLQIYAKGADTLLAAGEVVWVNADQKTHTSAPVPGALVERLEALEGRRLRKD